MKAGYACTPIGTPYKTTRKFILKNYNTDILCDCISDNLNGLFEILNYNLQNDIYMFRISSDIIPFGSHSVNTFNWSSNFSPLLTKIGDFAKDNDIRLSMHPGQYTVLNALDKEILKKSIDDLNYHCDFLDSLGIDKKNKLILHIGGVYGDKESSIKRFISNFNSLDSKVKARLIIENDEKNYSISDLLGISDKCNIPIVFDNLHHLCYTGSDNFKEPLESAFSTWNLSDGPPKVHYSEQGLNKRTGSHSNTIHAEAIDKYLSNAPTQNFDIMIEVKDKDFSALKLKNILLEQSSKTISLELLNKTLATYKFYLLERSLDTYKKGEHILLTQSFLDFYKFIDSIEVTPPSIDSSLAAYKLFIKDLKPLKDIELNYLHKLFITQDIIKIKSYLQKLALRSNKKDILNNYFLFF